MFGKKAKAKDSAPAPAAPADTIRGKIEAKIAWHHAQAAELDAIVATGDEWLGMNVEAAKAHTHPLDLAQLNALLNRVRL